MPENNAMTRECHKELQCCGIHNIERSVWKRYCIASKTHLREDTSDTVVCNPSNNIPAMFQRMIAQHRLCALRKRNTDSRPGRFEQTIQSHQHRILQ